MQKPKHRIILKVMIILIIKWHVFIVIQPIQWFVLMWEVFGITVVPLSRAREDTSEPITLHICICTYALQYNARGIFDKTFVCLFWELIPSK